MVLFINGKYNNINNVDIVKIYKEDGIKFQNQQINYK